VIGMDFAGLPPEINSGRMYAGPGSEPLVAAAAGWDMLAAELSSTAASYRAVVSQLTGAPWVGPSSMSMAAAAAPYVSWINATATQAGQTAAQLGSAVVAYEAAFAATVPPPEIEVNRALLASLVASNILGQNTPAIAATEAQYAEMWAQDAAAMYAYAGASSAATALSPFNAPPPTTNPASTATQAAAVGQAAATAAGPSAQSALQMAAVPNALQSLASGAFPGSNLLLDFFNSYPVQAFEELSNDVSGSLFFSYGANFLASGTLLTMTPFLAVLFNPLAASLAPPAVTAAAASDVPPDAASAPGRLGNAGVAAGLGEAATVGKLSVPPSWATASPAVRLAANALPITGLEALPQAGMVAPGSGYAGMPAMGPVASVVNAPRGEQTRARSGWRQSVIPALAREPGVEQDNSDRSVNGEGRASERDELNQLRRAVADVTRQRDVLKRTAATLIKEAKK
jgi:PPE-repeat protein